MNHCKDCRHFWRDEGEDVCRREREVHPKFLPSCESERDDGYFWSLAFGSCGKRGRYFEPKGGA